MANPLPTQKEFIRHLAALADADEQFLIVRQKLKRNRVELYADGSVKASWLPMSADDAGKIKDDWAIYGNTGSFVSDRMTEKLSASSANCDYVLVMVLDDIGTKSKTPPLEPTWKMETSEGNFQWGYIFSKQPKREGFAAAIRAVAEAGYTDPGATNATRNFRLPGSVNLKPGKGNFKSRLTEWHPEREFELEAICDAFGVEPQAEQATYKSTRLKRTDDEVLNWLAENDYLLGSPNYEGWAAVVCPNHESHSDPTDVGARYNVNDRGFCCYHEHCGHFSSQDFLDWVTEKGGPSVNHGSNDSEMTRLMQSAFDKIPESIEENQAVIKIQEELERKQASRVVKTELHKRFAYVMADDAYLDLLTRKVFPRNVFNAMYRHIECKSIHTGRKIEASIWFDENRERYKAPAVSELTYAPGESTMVLREGELCGNKWMDARPSVDLDAASTDIEPWMAHGRRLIPNENELNHVLDVMAFKLQNPKKKVNHAVLHAGRQGCGKDTFWAPFIWSVCGPYAKNRGYLDSKSINSPWGYHLESEVLLINELQEPTMAERKALANSLKPIIAAPPDYLDINRKGLHPYKAINRTFVLAFSNSRTAISLEGTDRRWFILWSEAPKMTDEEGARMWKWYNDGGLNAVAAFLHKRDVSRFMAGGTPPMTEAKLEMIDGGMSTSQAFLVDMMRQELGEFQNGVIAGPFYKLADRLQGQAPGSAKLHHMGIPEALQEAEWECIGRIKSKEFQTKKQVWVSPRMVKAFQAGKFTKSEFRNLVEESPAIHILREAK